MSSRSESEGVSQLPYQLLLDNVLPLLDIQTLIRLRSVSHAFKEAVDDDVVWRRRIRSDFRFPLQSSARTTGWKTVYRGLANTELYTWGEPSHNRLGIEIRKRQANENEMEALEGSDFNLITRYRSAPFPISIKWRNADFYDSSARVTESSQYEFERPPNFDFRQGIPLKRILPNGRDEKHSIDAGVPVEIHAGGWSFFLMTNLGQIITWGSSTGNGDSSGTEDTFKKPTLLDLNGRQARSLSVGRQHAVAQMDDGKVRKDMRSQSSDTPQASADRLRKELDRRYCQWELLSSFCENIRQAGSESQDGENVWDQADLKHLLSSNIRITHISAQFKNFAVYAPEAGKEGKEVDVQNGKGLGIVLLGSNDAHLRPKIIPELQGIGVIKVVQGDWHSGALLLDGSVITWGSQSNGALGTWDSIPTVEGAQSVFNIYQPPLNDFFSNMGGLVTGIFRPAMQARQQAHIRMQQQEQAYIRTQQEQAEIQSQNESQQSQNSSIANTMVKAEKDRYLLRNLPDQQPQPKPVRLGFPKIGELRKGKRMEESDSMETKYAFDIAFAGWHSGALAVDRSLIFDS
ncbi:hypothetical protein L7F22_039293 [Adiantum nelumboides]|nr:hypothetical protein [Adiantum nelumboides]